MCMAAPYLKEKGLYGGKGLRKGGEEVKKGELLKQAGQRDGSKTKNFEWGEIRSRLPVTKGSNWGEGQPGILGPAE